VVAITELKSYLKFLLLIWNISKYPIDDINYVAGFLRLKDICLYEPCLQYNIEKSLRKKTKKLIYKRLGNHS